MRFLLKLLLHSFYEIVIIKLFFDKNAKIAEFVESPKICKNRRKFLIITSTPGRFQISDWSPCPVTGLQAVLRPEPSY
jgi:hypothetical protein